ncbi:hypothetical protein NHU_04171 [Rhodovulum sulfidophilum]|uniref:CRISPR type III-associated protein domain-containing protein n=1 Tax=Rhodovulum sulfidophilum TaxID=35806 RepID=A0A0D6B8D7_RHOSU|nr:hypothetical protein NHU_04171 [Rhodovulum sulfidophilum]
MIGKRVDIEADLVVLTPLQIGTGAFREEERSDRDEQDREPDTRNVALVATDFDGAPCIPGSTLKGVLRRLSRDNDVLFGPTRIVAAEDARSGKAVFWTARIAGNSSDCQRNRPHVSMGTDTRTAKDPETGVAKRAHLFGGDYVRPGTKFRLRISLKDAEPGAADALAQVLARLAAADGEAFGRSTRQGQGRVALIPETLKAKAFPSGNDLTQDWQSRLAGQPSPDAPDLIRLSLTASGPFLIAGEERSDLRPGDDREKVRVMTALEDFDGQGPRLTGSTLLGALRARFDWYAAGLGDDCPSGATERLFGTPGWRGRIAVHAIRRSGTPERKKITSVRLDRFSGEPIDNALFTTEAWLNANFQVDLRFDRHGPKEPEVSCDTDLKIFNDFREELCDPDWGGIQLGLGGNKGFGWFDIREVSDA